MKTSLLVTGFATVLGVILLGCTSSRYGGDHSSGEITVSDPKPIAVSGPPPSYVTKSVSVAPGPSHVWIPGGWIWRDQKWVLEPGGWVVPPRPGALWHPAHFYHREGRYYYRPGYWS